MCSGVPDDRPATPVYRVIGINTRARDRRADVNVALTFAMVRVYSGGPCDRGNLCQGPAVAGRGPRPAERGGRSGGGWGRRTGRGRMGPADGAGALSGSTARAPTRRARRTVRGRALSGSTARRQRVEHDGRGEVDSGKRVWRVTYAGSRASSSASRWSEKPGAERVRLHPRPLPQREPGPASRAAPEACRRPESSEHERRDRSPSPAASVSACSQGTPTAWSLRAYVEKVDRSLTGWSSIAASTSASASACSRGKPPARSLWENRGCRSCFLLRPSALDCTISQP
jgi:hypothetical protein